MDADLLNRDVTQKIIVDTAKELNLDTSTVADLHDFQGKFLRRAVQMKSSVRLPSMGLFRFSDKKYNKYRELHDDKNRK